MKHIEVEKTFSEGVFLEKELFNYSWDKVKISPNL